MNFPDSHILSQLLQFTLSGFSAGQAFVWMVRNYKLKNCSSGINDPHGMSINQHSVISFSNAGGSKIFSSFNFNYTNPAASGLIFNAHIIKFHVTKRRNVHTYFPRCFKDCCPLFNFQLFIVYC